MNLFTPDFDPTIPEEEEKDTSLFDETGVPVPTGQSGFDYQKKVIKNFNENQTKNKETKEWSYSSINCFEFQGEYWSFTPTDYKIRDRIKNIKKQLLDKIHLELIKLNNQELQGDAETLIISYIKDFLSFLKIAYGKDRLLIAVPDNESNYYPAKLKSKSDYMRNETYQYFLKYALGQLFDFSVDEKNVHENQKIVLKPAGVLNRIKSFLEQHQII